MASDNFGLTFGHGRLSDVVCLPCTTALWTVNPLRRKKKKPKTRKIVCFKKRWRDWRCFFFIVYKCLWFSEHFMGRLILDLWDNLGNWSQPLKSQFTQITKQHIFIIVMLGDEWDFVSHMKNIEKTKFYKTQLFWSFPDTCALLRRINSLHFEQFN